ncbi:MAG: ribose 5-phosphate isomerase B [Alphaproteobacteria bacterium]|nr:ribose 5-phosphate isomerase B [Alphaproteobacteria bacterium]
MSEGTVAIASDHAGPSMKADLKAALEERGFTVLDLGTDGPESVDYPDFGKAVGEKVAGGDAQLGIVICGTGIGISIAANRIPGVRAAVCHDATSARLAREHNDANVMALGARLIGPEVALDCLDAFVSTAFSGGEAAARGTASVQRVCSHVDDNRGNDAGQ